MKLSDILKGVIKLQVKPTSTTVSINFCLNLFSSVTKEQESDVRLHLLYVCFHSVESQRERSPQSHMQQKYLISDFDLLTVLLY